MAAAALTVVILIGAGLYALVIADETGGNVGFQNGDLVKPTTPSPKRPPAPLWTTSRRCRSTPRTSTCSGT